MAADAAWVREVLFGTVEPSARAFQGFLLRIWALYGRVSQSSGRERVAIKEEYTAEMRANMWIATMLCASYALAVHGGRWLIREQVWSGLQPLLAIWNAFLFLFSAAGVMASLPCLLRIVREDGFRASLCVRPVEMQIYDTQADLWIGVFFVFSKVIEFNDTYFKVLMGRNVSLLHWWHHMMTCWVAWYSLAYGFSPGIWFGVVNFSVHSIMYLYFSSLCAAAQDLSPGRKTRRRRHHFTANPANGLVSCRHSSRVLLQALFTRRLRH